MNRLPRILAAAVVIALACASSALAAGTGADLQVSGSASSGSVLVGSSLVYTFQVKASGPQTANSIVFTDVLPAGTTYVAAGASGFPGACSAAGGTVTCNLGSLGKGSQVNIMITVTAPLTAGTFSNTGTVSSATPDPSPSNNSATVTVKTQSPTCALPAGQTTITGFVMAKYTDPATGLFENFKFQGNDGVSYTVLTNFYDGTRALTNVINLLCKASPVQFINNFVTVTGTVGMEPVLGQADPTPVIHASVVQVFTTKDRV